MEYFSSPGQSSIPDIATRCGYAKRVQSPEIEEEPLRPSHAQLLPPKRLSVLPTESQKNPYLKMINLIL